jgi:hypothetical protein
MSDLHVNSMTYEVKAGAGALFNEKSCLQRSTDQFDLEVRGGLAVFRFKAHFANEGEARQVTEALIRTWQIWDGTEHAPGELCFIFQSADVVDRAPPASAPGGNIDISVTMSAMGTMRVEKLTVSRDYPAPPDGFIASEEVRAMYYQYEALRAGTMPLGMVAYLCLNVLERRMTLKYDSTQKLRTKASADYTVDEDVLNTLGDLSSKKGGKEARKAEGLSSDFTGSETRWLHAVIRALIRRVGEVDAGPKKPLVPITMTSLPPIDP